MSSADTVSTFDWNWRHRPLFWFALAVAAVLAVWKPDFAAKNDVSRFISPSAPGVYVGGRVDSEIEVREDAFGSESLVFVLAAQKFWKDSSGAGQKVSGKVRVSMRGSPDIRYGDVVALSGELRAPRGLRNPGGFDQKAWLARQGIRSLLNAGKGDRFKILERGKGNPLLAGIVNFKAACLDRLRRDFSDRDAAVLAALFFGVRSDIDDAVKDRFLRTGTLHLLAVSGFNVGFVLAAVFFLLAPFHVRRPVRLAVGLAAAWLYVLLVGPQSPVFRAGVMATVWLLGEILGRRSDPLNSLGLSALILWALRPLELFDPGFQLSYAAVIGIVIAVPRLAPRPELFPGETLTFTEKLAREGQLLFWTSCAAQAATLPISVAHFYVVTPWSVFANVPAGFLVFALFMAGAVQMAVSALIPFLAAPAAWIVKGLLALLLGILSGFERLPLAMWTTGRLSWLIWLLLAAACLIFLFSTEKTPVFRVAVFALAAALCFGAQNFWRSLDRSFEATFLDVGQGDAIHLRFPDGTNWLVDAGQGRAPDMGRAVLVPYFRHEGIRRLDSVAITHPQEDHIGGFSSVVDEIPITEYVDPGVPYDSAHYRRILAALKRRHVPIVAVQTGDESELPGGMRVTVLGSGPPPGAENINDASIVLRFTHPSGGLVLTGDAGERAFARINASGRPVRADVLKVPHHGAKPGREERLFLSRVKPSVSVISSGERNRYGHPSKEALDALEAIPNNRTYRTDRSGAVRAVFDETGVRFLDGPAAFA